MCKCSFALQCTFSLKPAVIMLTQEGTRKTIKPKIFIINLNPNLLPSKGMMVSHNCLCWYYIKICKGLLSKTEIMLFAVKLENNSQDKIEISLSALLFISWFCFQECLRSNSIFFF